ncbi:MAG: pimeloyl-ACP methyl ester carboxylesterase [Flammeovirgaceae bacterium]|jgi:pimeloyl-ACP methyl ester carboxylesterase
MTATPTINSPSKIWLFTEGGRAMFDWGLSIFSKPIWKDLPNGNGEPVLVLPGFMASDISTKYLRNFLKKKNYTPYSWGLGRNKGDFTNTSPTIFSNLDKITSHHNQKIHLIGWSLGGVFAREIAKEKPDLVKSVITMGSPFANINQKTNASWLFDFVSKRVKTNEEYSKMDTIHEPPTMPSTAIFSKSDGIVNWKGCLEPEMPHTENVQVHAAHMSLGVHPASLVCIADRLAQKEGDWKPFQPVGKVKNMFPSF